MDKLVISGSGGGGKGGGGHTPTEQADNLHSSQYARVVDLVCEGEIEGWSDPANPWRCVFLDDVVVEDSTGRKTFSEIGMAYTWGTQSQSALPSHLGGVGTVTWDGGIVEQATPTVVNIPVNTNADYVLITLALDALLKIESNGDIVGHKCRYQIHLQNNGGGYVLQVDKYFSGKTTSTYTRGHWITLLPPGPWDVKVTRVSADDSSSKKQSAFRLQSYTTWVADKFRYPNSALIGIEVNSKQFTRIPRRGYKLKLLKVKVPDVYNPATRTYSGAWDGVSWQTAWTDNPAWCFYDMVTNDRYGLGQFVPEALMDVWSLHSISQYCDELVPDGKGGTEPRFSCNVYFQSRAEAIEVVNTLASVFRGMVWWGGGALMVACDKDSDPVANFNNGNVVDGRFQYEGTSKRARHTAVLVAWSDPSKNGRQSIEYVSDDTMISKYGVRETAVTALGANTQGQARRLGKAILAAEKLETETVTFRTGLESIYVYPSAVIEIADQYRAGVQYGGRIVATSTSSIFIIDSFDVIPVTGTQTITIRTSGGTLETRTIQSTVETGLGVVITTTTGFSEAPPRNTPYVLRDPDNVVPQKFRVLSVVETEEHLAEVVAVKHDPNKYALIDDGELIADPPTSVFNATLDSPTNITFTESLYKISPSEVAGRVRVSWDEVTYAAQYRIEWEDANGEIFEADTKTVGYDVSAIQPGTWTFRVWAVNMAGVAGPPSEVSQSILGVLEDPSDVEDFAITILGSEAHLTWSPVADLDVMHYWLKFTSDTSSPKWGASFDLVPEISANNTSITVPARNGSYLIKAVDQGGRTSVTASIVSSNVDGLDNFNYIDTFDEAPAFSGTLTDVTDVGAAIELTNPSTDPVGTYAFNKVEDLGAVYTSRVSPKLTASGKLPSNVLASFVPLSSASTLSGADPDNWAVEITISTCQDDPATSTTWTTYEPILGAGDYKARGIRWMATLTSIDGETTPSVSELGMDVDMPDRVDKGDNVASASGTKSITYSPAFRATPAVAVSVQNMAQGDYYTISTTTSTGFTINFFDSGSNPVDRTFDWVAKGWGYKG